MYRGLRVAAVLPAFNEERFIDAALDMLPADIFDDMIVVDDASTDSTAQKASAHPSATLVSHDVNRGVGAALVTGFITAVERDNDVAVVIPGDGQADLKALGPMLDRIVDGYGLVISDRLTERSAVRYGMPRHRIWGSRVLSVMTWLTTGLWIPDPQSGYKAMPAATIKRLPLEKLYPRWGFHNDVLSYCALLRIPVTTVPADPVYHAPDGTRITSHIKLWDLIPRHLRVFSRMLLRRLRFAASRTRPRSSAPDGAEGPVSSW
jgi:glycosyltransferase involved in cell wall biosynthesis